MEFQRLAEIIADVMNLDPKEISVDTSFIEDLGADSLDVYQIMIAVEEELQCELDSNQVEKIRTVGEVLELVNGTDR